jgi:hypothetical protein
MHEAKSKALRLHATDSLTSLFTDRPRRRAEHGVREEERARARASMWVRGVLKRCVGASLSVPLLLSKRRQEGKRCMRGMGLER